jgi:3-oxoacyl-[acyl-carrier protein] reductase
VKNLGGRVAVVTGAAGGVGRGIAEVLAAEGAAVAIADIDLGAAEAFATELAEAGREGLAVEVDVADRDSIDAMAAAVIGRWGRLDILSVNAGIYPASEVAELDHELLERVLAINVVGAFHSIRACLGPMRAQKYGRIVLTSSITGPLVGAVGYAPYGATKSAMLGMMKSIALEVAEDGITVNAVQPGNVRTPGFEALTQEWKDITVQSIPLGRLAEPADVGWAVRFFAAEEAGYITGSSVVLDGGQTLPESPG